MQKLFSCVWFLLLFVFCVSLAIFSVFCIGLAIFCSNPLQKPGVHCFLSAVRNLLFPVCLPFSVYYLVYQESWHLSCLELILYCLESAISQVHTFLSGVCCCLLLGGLFSVCCQESYFCVVLSQLLESAMFCLMGEEVPPCVSGEEMNTCASFSHCVLLQL